MLGLCHKNLPVTLLIRKEDKHFDINKYISEGYVILSGEEMYRTALSRRVAKLNANPANLRGGGVVSCRSNRIRCKLSI